MSWEAKQFINKTEDNFLVCLFYTFSRCIPERIRQIEAAKEMEESDSDSDNDEGFASYSSDDDADNEDENDEDV